IVARWFLALEAVVFRAGVGQMSMAASERFLSSQVSKWPPGMANAPCGPRRRWKPEALPLPLDRHVLRPPRVLKRVGPHGPRPQRKAFPACRPRSAGGSVVVSGVREGSPAGEGRAQ